MDKITFTKAVKMCQRYWTHALAYQAGIRHWSEITPIARTSLSLAAATIENASITLHLLSETSGQNADTGFRN